MLIKKSALLPCSYDPLTELVGALVDRGPTLHMFTNNDTSVASGPECGSESLTITLCLLVDNINNFSRTTLNNLRNRK